MGTPVRFIVEGASELELGFVPEFVLEEDDLPKDLEYGTKLRKTVTRYSGTYASVQVHGTEYKAIDLEGVFEDSWRGIPGHAAAMRNTIDAIVSLGELVRLEYEDLVLWGTLDAAFTIRNFARVEYKITFEPYWREDPRLSLYIAFAEPPNDLGETVDSRLADAESYLSNPPDGLDAGFVKSLIFDLARARNQVSGVLGYISGVADYAELTAQQIGLVQRGLFAAVRTLSSTTDRLRNAGENVVENSASAWLLGGEYVLEGTRRVRRTLEDLVLMLRKFLETGRPRRQRTHTVREGDTLQRLARLYLGDYARWTEIADANDLDSTATLTKGDVLKIPRR